MPTNSELLLNIISLAQSLLDVEGELDSDDGLLLHNVGDQLDDLLFFIEDGRVA